MTEVSQGHQLDFYAGVAGTVHDLSGVSLQDFRMVLVSVMLDSLASAEGSNAEDLLLGFSPEEAGYISWLKTIVPQLSEKALEKPDSDTREGLLSLFPVALNSTIWYYINDLAEKSAVDADDFIAFCSDNGFEPLHYKSSFDCGDFVEMVTEDADMSGEDNVFVLDSSLAIYTAFVAANGKVNSTSPEEEEVEEDEEDEEEDFPDPEVDAATHRIMGVYKDLFEVGFELDKPFGILTKEGALRLNGKGKTVVWEQESLANIYNIFLTLSNGFLSQGDLVQGTSAEMLRKVEMQRGITYYPEFQLGNLFGILGDTKVDSWNALEKALKPEIKRNISENRKAGRDIASIVDSLTTCMVISEFRSDSALRIRANVGNNLLTSSKFNSEYNAKRTTIMQGIGSVFHNKSLKSGVLELILVFNEAGFNGKPLFAYQAVESLKARGRMPSISNMILGQDTSGKIKVENMDRQNAAIVLIGAGQRSGKGVLTLNLLGTVIASGSPLIYLDGKPDMATVLWNIGKKYGVNPAAWDASEPNGNVLGMNAPPRIVMENPDIFGVLVYLKALQLMLVAAMFQANKTNPWRFGDGKRPFFIFDEALAVQVKMSGAWREILKIAKSKTSDPEEKEWCTAVVKWGESLSASLNSVILSQLPASGISTVWLFQSVQPTSWNEFQTEGFSGKFNILKQPIMSRTSIKILGRGTSDSEYGLMNLKGVPEIANRVLNANGRNFAWTETQKITGMEGVSVFKPYLVLNEVGAGSPYEEELKKNVSPDVWNVISQEDGHLHPGAGFDGFASILGADAIQNLNLGRAYLEAVMTKAGIMSNYSSVDEYLYDCSIDSFQTTGALTNGGGVSSDMEDGGVYDPDVYGNGESDEEVASGTDTEQDFSWSTNPSSDPQESDASRQEGTLDDQAPEPSQPWGSMGDPVSGHSATPDFTQSASKSVEEPVRESKQPPVKPIENASSYSSPNNTSGYDQVYTGKMDIPNPFNKSSYQGVFSSINPTRAMSDHVMEEIKKLFGGYDRITSVELTSTGLVINGVAFKPQFSDEIIDSMPIDMKFKVQRGNIVDIFAFEKLLKFKNLEVLRIDTVRLAEGRVARELYLNPKRGWSDMFRKFRYLQYIDIAGNRITKDSDSQDAYERKGRSGYDLTEKVRGALNVPLGFLSNSRMEQVWQSRPVRVMTGAVGWTLGIKAVTVAASLFGPWGLLFGAFAGYGAYREMKKRQ